MLLPSLQAKHGATFQTDTDTEVVPKLCKYVFDNLQQRVPFPKLVMEVLKKLEGAYALLIKSSHYPGGPALACSGVALRAPAPVLCWCLHASAAMPGQGRAGSTLVLVYQHALLLLCCDSRMTGHGRSSQAGHLQQLTGPCATACASAREVP
jgi:hypothetical protein